MLGLTQEALGGAIGGSKRGIQDNERMNRMPRGKALRGFMDLGIRSAWLLTGEGEMWQPGRGPVPLAENPLASDVTRVLEAARTIPKVADALSNSQLLDVAALAASLQLARALVPEGSPEQIGEEAALSYVENYRRIKKITANVNVGAVAMMMSGALKRWGMDADAVALAQKVSEFYELQLAMNQITPTGIGPGGAQSA